MALQKGEALYCNKAWNSDGMWKRFIHEYN